jgi:hypothetical protein
VSSDRETHRGAMRETVANVEAARAAGHTQVTDALIEVARSFHRLQRFDPPEDPIVTATLARVLPDDREALALYLDALRQNKILPDERSYEWRLPLAARFLSTGEIPHAVTELRECRAQAVDAGDHPALLCADGLLASLPMRTKRVQVYTDGTELHAGHRVTYNGQPGTVVCVIENDEYAPGFASTAWDDLDTGLMIRFDNGAILHLDEADEYLVRVQDEGAASPP